MAEGTRRRIAILLTVLLSCMMLVACGSQKDNIEETAGEDVTAGVVITGSEGAGLYSGGNYADTAAFREETSAGVAVEMEKSTPSAPGTVESETGGETTEIEEEPAAQVTEELQEIVETEETDDADGEEPEEEQQETLTESSAVGGGRLVVIDPGHQSQGNNEKEPIGPGAAETKAKVTGGTHGPTSGLYEYQLTLTVAQKLRDELTSRGYTVQMTRESNDVNISNSERAAVANQAGAGAFIRIHANGSEDTSVNGAMTICQTPSNPYNGNIYQKSRALSDAVLEHFVSETGCKKQYVWETDSMSGINWCQVPTTIIEMGYMTNPTEDSNMASADYQSKMVKGMADGIDAFFGNQ